MPRLNNAPTVSSTPPTGRTLAIIKPEARPMIDIVGNSQLGPVNHPAWDWLAQGQIAQRLGQCARAVGLLLLEGHPSLSVCGTGFLISDRLVVTNRHVARYFAGGSGLRTRLFPEMRVWVNFARQVDGGSAPTIQVARMRLIDPKWDIAVMELAYPAQGIPPLRLNTATPNADAHVAVIGYPMLDGENPVELQKKMLRNIWPVKRLQPGKYHGIQVQSGLNCMTHDCSTLAGNSGSPLIDIASATVVGLHFWGRFMEVNLAHPMAEILNEPYARQLGLV